MSNLRQETDALASWPTGERLRAWHRSIPRVQVDAGLAQTGHDRAVGRRLPGWFLGGFLIALGLCCREGSRQLCRWLQPFRPGAVPGRSTLCEARQRLGIAPRRGLAEPVIRRRGPPRTPGAVSRGMRTRAVDGFVLDLAETPAQARAVGRPGSGRAPGAVPQMRLLALCETGSHGRWRLLLKPLRPGEGRLTPYLLRHLQAEMLLLWDRNCLSYSTVSAVLVRGSHLLARSPSNRIVEPIKVLPAGSYLSKLYRRAADRRHDRHGIWVRIIAYTVDDPGRSGTGERHRLLTPLLEAELAPAKPLVCLYPERGEEERRLEDVKPPQRERPVLRSQTPAGVVQEVYGLWLAHSGGRVLRQEAAATQDLAPRRLSFPATGKMLRCRLPACPASQRGCPQWYGRLGQEIAEEVRELRRNRINPRGLKRQRSHWPQTRPWPRRSPQPTKPFEQAIVMRH